MQIKASDHLTIEYSEPEIGALISEEPDVVAEVSAFHTEIAKWAAEQARGRSLGAKDAANELRHWSRKYFGAVVEPADAARDGSWSAAEIAA